MIRILCDSCVPRVLQWDDLLMSIPTDPALMGLLQPLVLPPLYDQDTSPVQPQHQLPSASLPAATSTAVLPADGSCLAGQTQVRTLAGNLQEDATSPGKQIQAGIISGILPTDAAFPHQQPQADTLKSDVPEDTTLCGRQPPPALDAATEINTVNAVDNSMHAAEASASHAAYARTSPVQPASLACGPATISNPAGKGRNSGCIH